VFKSVTGIVEAELLNIYARVLKLPIDIVEMAEKLYNMVIVAGLTCNEQGGFHSSLDTVCLRPK
jgi:hypothetical protein